MSNKYVQIANVPSRTLHTYQDVANLLRTESGKTLLRRSASYSNSRSTTTFIERGPNGIQLRLHKTAILTWHRDDTITLNTGGWYTMTTREKMNAFLPSHREWHGNTSIGDDLLVGNIKGYWYVNTARGMVAYHDGMNLDMRTMVEFTPERDISKIIVENVRRGKIIDRWLDDWSKQISVPARQAWLHSFDAPDSLLGLLEQRPIVNPIEPTEGHDLFGWVGRRNGAGNYANEWAGHMLTDGQMRKWVRSKMRRTLRSVLYLPPYSGGRPFDYVRTPTKGWR